MRPRACTPTGMQLTLMVIGSVLAGLLIVKADWPDIVLPQKKFFDVCFVSRYDDSASSDR